MRREGHDLTKCLSAVVEAATAITGAPRGSLQLVEQRSGMLTIAAQKGFTNQFLRFFAEVREDAPVTAAAAMRMRQKVLIEDVTRSDIFYDQTSIKVLIEAGVRAVQSTPLVEVDGKVFGVLSTHFSGPHRPEHRELQFIDLLARQTADYLNRIYAEKALRKLQLSLKAEVESRTRERDRIWNVSEDLFGVSNFEGYFLSVNPAWERTLGWTEGRSKLFTWINCGTRRTGLILGLDATNWHMVFLRFEWRIAFATRTGRGVGLLGHLRRTVGSFI